MPLSETFSIEKANLAAKIQELEVITSHYKGLDTVENKVQYLTKHPKVKFFFLKNPSYIYLLDPKNLDEQLVILSLIIIDQLMLLFPYQKKEKLTPIPPVTKITLDRLKEVEYFFSPLGGLVGYQLEALRLLFQQINGSKEVTTHCSYFPPDVVDIHEETSFVRKMKIQGIQVLQELAEIYPIGGAADRLNLQDEKTFLNLPAARLEFLGHSLIEGMIHDLQSREYLYYKLFHQRILTPVALMTSSEKNNHNLIQETFEEHQYFKRPRGSFCFFEQPLVPTFTKEGCWCLKQVGELLMKPGGHGAIWKLCRDQKVFDWLKGKGRKKALVRQINNPIAGVDSGLIVLAGIGHAYKKHFGFASCPRKHSSHEGMNVTKVESSEEGTTQTLTNIEYCDFKKFGIEDSLKREGQQYSQYPANTNVLYVDLKAIQEAASKIPYPGMLINFKKMKYWDPHEGEKEEGLARIELLMQNIADAFTAYQKGRASSTLPFDLPSFITFNSRNKTISTTKKQFIPGAGLVETAVGCYYDYLKNGWDLLRNTCLMDVPALPSEEEFLLEGPSFIFKYHPALGPLYEIIGQKISHGSLSYLSELQLEIADVLIEKLHLEGSLVISAKNVLGHLDEEDLLIYSDRTGRCTLKNVNVVNLGIDRQAEHIYWKNKITRKESLEIILEGYSEFYAENVTFEGSYKIHVPHGKKITAQKIGGELVFHEEALPEKEEPYWKYSISDDSRIELSK